MEHMGGEDELICVGNKNQLQYCVGGSWMTSR